MDIKYLLGILRKHTMEKKQIIQRQGNIKGSRYHNNDLGTSFGFHLAQSHGIEVSCQALDKAIPFPVVFFAFRFVFFPLEVVPCAKQEGFWIVTIAHFHTYPVLAPVPVLELVPSDSIAEFAATSIKQSRAMANSLKSSSNFWRSGR